MNNSEPQFARSPWLPDTLHLHDLYPVPVPGCAPAVYPCGSQRRLLLPGLDCYGDCGHWRVHSGQQYAPRDDSTFGIIVANGSQHFLSPSSSSTEPIGAPWRITKTPCTKSHLHSRQRVVRLVRRITHRSASTTSRCMSTVRLSRILGESR